LLAIGNERLFSHHEMRPSVDPVLSKHTYSGLMLMTKYGVKASPRLQTVNSEYKGVG